ncbi:MAG: OmpP1/FadL family transporter [Gammaproteobacteria bacterium]
MISRKFATSTFFVTVLMSLAGAANAGGLYISEFGQPSQGASGAGGGALAEDASAAFQNPASVMGLDESQWMVTAIGITGSAKFDTNDSNTTGMGAPGTGYTNGGDAFESAIGAALFYANPFSEKFGFGLSFNSISGAGLDYDDNFVGRYWAEEVTLLTINLTPSFSYRVNDQWSVAVGVSAMYGTLEMDVAIPGPAPGGDLALAQIEDGDDVSATISLSTFFELDDRTRFGLAYLGENELSFDSDLTLTPPLPAGTIGADIEMVWPQTLRLHGARELGNNLTMLATIAWEDWSTFDSVPISTANGGNALPRNWGDTYKFSLGMKWDTLGSGAYYAGVAFDTDPTDANNRTADMPIDEQWRFSVGGTWDTSERMQLGAVLTYADNGDAKIQNGGTRPGPVDWFVDGEYSSNNAIFLGLNLNYK